MKAPEQYRLGKLVRWRHPDREWLEYHYLTLDKSGPEIAAEIGSDRTTPSKWLRKHGIKKVRPYENIDWLRHQYIDLDKSIRDIAKECNVSVVPIARQLKNAGIEKDKKHLAAKHSKRMSGEGNPAWNGGTAQNYQRRLLESSDKPYHCTWCGMTKRLQVHHVDHDRDNGDLDNLEWLCGPCNRMEAQIHSLERTGRATVERRGSTMILTFTGG